jgi:hypothetical protein
MVFEMTGVFVKTPPPHFSGFYPSVVLVIEQDRPNRFTLPENA